MGEQNTIWGMESEHRHRLRSNIWLTEAWLRTGMKDFLSQYDVTLQQVNILRILREANEPLSTKELAERMIDKNSDTSRLVDRMVSKDLVRKRKDSNDRRLVQVSINYEGLKLLAKIDDDLDEVDERMFRLGSEEIEQLNELLEKIRS